MLAAAAKEQIAKTESVQTAQVKISFLNPKNFSYPKHAIISIRSSDKEVLIRSENFAKINNYNLSGSGLNVRTYSISRYSLADRYKFKTFCQDNGITILKPIKVSSYKDEHNDDEESSTA